MLFSFVLLLFINFQQRIKKINADEPLSFEFEIVALWNYFMSAYLLFHKIDEARHNKYNALHTFFSLLLIGRLQIKRRRRRRRRHIEQELNLVRVSVVEACKLG